MNTKKQISYPTPIAFDCGESSRFAHVRAWIACTFLDCENDQVANHRDVYPAEHSQSHGSYEWVWIREIPLKRVDAKEC